MNKPPKKTTALNEPPRKSHVVTQEEADFITRRAHEQKIDVVGRLEWIEDALQMISTARNSLK
jgi:hypothetical protein